MVNWFKIIIEHTIFLYIIRYTSNTQTPHIMKTHRIVCIACIIFCGILLFQSCAPRRCAGIKAHPDYYINGARNW